MSIYDTDAQHKTKVEAYFQKLFAPLTPEEQLFYNGQQWLVFDGETMTDIAFDTKEAALAFASRDIMTDLVAANLNYKPDGIKQRIALGFEVTSVFAE